jgi:hypothetical protein
MMNWEGLKRRSHFIIAKLTAQPRNTVISFTFPEYLIPMKTADRFSFVKNIDEALLC